jgi:hypothetical protein
MEQRESGKQWDNGPVLTAGEEGHTSPLASASHASEVQPQPRREFGHHKAHLLSSYPWRNTGDGCSIAESLMACKEGTLDG